MVVVEVDRLDVGAGFGLSLPFLETSMVIDNSNSGGTNAHNAERAKKNGAGGRRDQTTKHTKKSPKRVETQIWLVTRPETIRGLNKERNGIALCSHFLFSSRLFSPRWTPAV